MKRILITGGSSYLGRRLVPSVAEYHHVGHTYFQHKPFESKSAWRLDVRDGEKVRRLVIEWKPDVIIHTTGSNRSPDMESVICQGADHISEAATTVGARLIHISSDVIFNGREAPYREIDPPKPMHAYGRSKARAEEIVSRHEDHVIIRTSLIYGLEDIDHSTAWTANALLQGQTTTLFKDQIRNPVWIETLCQACIQLVDLDFRGVLNIAGDQVLSRAEYGLKMLDWWGVTKRDTLQIGHSGGKWPVDCRLDLGLARKVVTGPLLGVDQVLDLQKKKRFQEQ